MAKPKEKWSGAFDAIYHDRFTPGQDPDELARQRYLASMRSPAPVQWFSDHLREDQRLRGAVYIAIKVLADQAASAQVILSFSHTGRCRGDAVAKCPPGLEGSSLSSSILMRFQLLSTRWVSTSGKSCRARAHPRTVHRSRR